MCKRETLGLPARNGRADGQRRAGSTIGGAGSGRVEAKRRRGERERGAEEAKKEEARTRAETVGAARGLVGALGAGITKAPTPGVTRQVG